MLFFLVLVFLYIATVSICFAIGEIYNNETGSKNDSVVYALYLIPVINIGAFLGVVFLLITRIHHKNN